MIACLSSTDIHIDLKVVDGTFHNGSDLVEKIPFFGIPLETGKHAEIHDCVCISDPPFLGGAAGLFTVTDPFSFYFMDFWTAPFIPVRASFS